MNTSLTATGTGRPNTQIEEYGRLALALVLSAGAHLLLAQLLPQWVRPYEGAPSAANFTLTVSLQPMSRVRPRAPAPVQPPPKSGEPVDGAIPGDQPQLSMLPPERPRDSLPGTPILPDTPPHEVRPALPLLDYYYSSREVDEPAKAVGDALLVYPPEALQLRVPGEVKLRLFIDEFGELVRSEVVNADPPGIFEEAALEAVGGMHFTPARKGGQTVRSQRTVQITFDPDPPALRNARSTLRR